jgi:hypothetical protein
MNATRQVKRKRSKKNRTAIPPSTQKTPPKLPPLDLLNLSFFDVPEPPDCEDEFDPPGWPR